MNKILVTYATNSGSTAEVAKAVMEEIQKSGVIPKMTAVYTADAISPFLVDLVSLTAAAMPARTTQLAKMRAWHLYLPQRPQYFLQANRLQAVNKWMTVTAETVTGMSCFLCTRPMENICPAQLACHHLFHLACVHTWLTLSRASILSCSVRITRAFILAVRMLRSNQANVGSTCTPPSGLLNTSSSTWMIGPLSFISVDKVPPLTSSVLSMP